MKRMITITVFIIGVLVLRMGAMEQGAGSSRQHQQQGNQETITFVTNDGKKFIVPKNKGLLFGTIKDMLEDVIEDETNTEIALANVSGPIMQQLIEDLNWVIKSGRIQGERKTEEEEEKHPAKRRKIELSSRGQATIEIDQQILERALLGLPIGAYSENNVRTLIEYLEAANYLNSPTLIAFYAYKLACMLTSDASLELLYANNPEQVALINKIRSDLKDKIYAYIPHDIWFLEHTFLYDVSKSCWKTRFSPDGNRIIMVSGEKVDIWNAKTRQLEHTFNATKASYFGLSPDSIRIATTTDRKTGINPGVYTDVWNMQTGKLEHSFEGEINGNPFSPDSHRIVTYLNNTAKVWNVQTGLLELTLAGHNNRVMSAEFSPDGNRILTASWDRTAKVWNANTGMLEQTLEGHYSRLRSALFSPDGKRILTISENGLRVWNAQTGVEEYSIQYSEFVRPSFSRNSRKLLIGFAIWNAQAGEREHILKGHTGAAYSGAFSPDSNRVATGSKDKTAKIWNAHTGKLEYTLVGHTWWVNSVSFSPDGNRIVTSSNGSAPERGMAKIWYHLPMNFNKALLIQLFQWMQKNNRQLTLTQNPWVNAILNSFNDADRAILIRSYQNILIDSQSASSSSNSNNQ